jgi:hypothetical protein
VIDMRALLIDKGTTFFGREAGGAMGRLATIKKAKAFPENMRIASIPASDGRLKSFHSISLLRDNPSYKPRMADTRVGFSDVSRSGQVHGRGIGIGTSTGGTSRRRMRTAR